MIKPCTSVVSKSGDRLIVNVPAAFKGEFPQGTDVELVKITKNIERIE
jgi:hypothetical protein